MLRELKLTVKELPLLTHANASSTQVRFHNPNPLDGLSLTLVVTNGNASFSHFLKCEGFNWGRIWLHVYTDVPYVFGPINPAIDDVVRNLIV